MSNLCANHLGFKTAGDPGVMTMSRFAHWRAILPDPPRWAISGKFNKMS